MGAGGDVTEIPRLPRVTLILELEATPRLVVDAASPADREALAAWMHETRPGLDKVLSDISRELAAKKAA